MLHRILQRTGYSIWIVMSMLVCSVVVKAQDHELDHQPLQKSSELHFEQVLSSALSNAPELLAASAREQQVSAYQSVGGSLFAGNPSLQASYISDRILDNVGLKEMEAGIAIPLWWPGQKQQSRNLGQHYDVLYQSWLSYTQWQVVGRLRQVLLDIQRAEILLDYERQSLTTAEALEQLATALFDAGEAPELDVLSARAMVLEQRNRVFEAEAELVDAERNYQVITGLNVVPATPLIETAKSNPEIPVDHPWLNYLRANVAVASSTVDQVRQRSAGNPVLGFGYRREQGSRFDDSIDSLGISIDIPLGKSPRVAADVSDARRAEADMQVAMQQARIGLNQLLHEAEHQAFVTQQKLAESQAGESINQQRWEMARFAYELGETDLFSVQRALQDLQATQKQRHSLELELQTYYSQINQSLGIQP